MGTCPPEADGIPIIPPQNITTIEFSGNTFIRITNAGRNQLGKQLSGLIRSYADGSENSELAVQA